MFKIIQFSKHILRLGLVNDINPKCQLFKHNLHKLLSQNRRVFYSNTTDNKIIGINPDINIEELTNGDAELEKKLRVIILEVDVLRQEGLRIPELSFLKEQHWKELLTKESRSQRNRYLEFLWKIEKKKENARTKKEERAIERENRPEYEDTGHIRYGLNHNTFLIRIYDTTINQLYNNRLIRAMQFGQKLVIDCGYDDNMTQRECINCAKQLMLTFAENRTHDDPFDLHFCNANLSKATMNYLNRHIATLHEPWFPLSIHESSYLDQFPKEQLVYLSPHCRDELSEFDHDAVYIIGAIVDKVNQEPLSMAKAKREGIRMAKLPLDRYLQWGDGSGKSLTLNHMIAILLDIKSTGDWTYALRHVPRRKIEKTYRYNNNNTNTLPYDKDTSRKPRSTNRDFIKQLLNDRS